MATVSNSKNFNPATEARLLTPQTISNSSRVNFGGLGLNLSGALRGLMTQIWRKFSAFLQKRLQISQIFFYGCGAVERWDNGDVAWI